MVSWLCLCHRAPDAARVATRKAHATSRRQHVSLDARIREEEVVSSQRPNKLEKRLQIYLLHRNSGCLGRCAAGLSPVSISSIGLSHRLDAIRGY